MRIGIDFDNTIAGYDALFAALAAEDGAVCLAPANKREIRDGLRQQPDGEARWQRLQATAYGRRMSDAELIDGVARFLNACWVAGIDVHIVSHKTRYANNASDGTDLRVAALNWMRKHHFFDADGFGLRPDHVHFNDTREAKLGRIAELDCACFIDDLEEVFAEPGFPDAVDRLLFDPAGSVTPCAKVKRFRHWDEIREYVFGRRN